MQLFELERNVFYVYAKRKTDFGVNLMRSQVLYWAAQDHLGLYASKDKLLDHYVLLRRVECQDRKNGCISIEVPCERWLLLLSLITMHCKSVWLEQCMTAQVHHACLMPDIL